MADITHAAGFASIRSFNATVREVYAATPSELRAAARRRAGGPGAAAVAGRSRGGASADAPTTVALRLPFREPLHVPSLFGHLVATAVPGLEEWRDGALIRALALPGRARARPPPGLLPQLPEAGRARQQRHQQVVPAIGWLVSRDYKAYKYLPDSVRAFPPADALADMFRSAGLEDVTYQLLGFGTVAMHSGVKH